MWLYGLHHLGHNFGQGKITKEKKQHQNDIELLCLIMINYCYVLLCTMIYYDLLRKILRSIAIHYDLICTVM